MNLLDVNDVAELLAVSAASVRRIPRSLLPIVQVGRLVRYRRQDVEGYVSRRLRGELRPTQIDGHTLQFIGKGK